MFSIGDGNGLQASILQIPNPESPNFRKIAEWSQATVL
jgi:hypothetical protein